jgi:hypothetical protein
LYARVEEGFFRNSAAGFEAPVNIGHGEQETRAVPMVLKIFWKGMRDRYE